MGEVTSLVAPLIGKTHGRRISSNRKIILVHSAATHVDKFPCFDVYVVVLWQIFPGERYGMDYDLNWSMNTDGVTPGGDAFHNLPVLNLLMYSQGKLTPRRAIRVESATEPAPSLSTDEYPGLELMDVEMFDTLRERVKDDLHLRKRLFVEDAAVGSYRTSEIKVRLITDSPELNLYFRNVLVRVPVPDVDLFPRHIVVVANTHSPVRDAQGKPFVVSDIDPDTALSSKATVLASGPVPMHQIQRHVAHCASQLALMGGYRHCSGASHSQQRAMAQEDWDIFPDDPYWKADPAAPHPDLLVVPGEVLLNATGQGSLIVNPKQGTDAVLQQLAGEAGPAGSSTKAETRAKASPNANAKEGDGQAAVDMTSRGLYAAHHCVWDADRVSRLWGGASLPSKALRGDVPRGSLVTAGRTMVAFEGPQALPTHPAKVIFAGAKDGKADRTAVIDSFHKELHWGEEALEKLRNRLDKTEVVGAKDAAAAIAQARR